MTIAPNLPACFQEPESRDIIERICETHGIDIKLLEDIIQISRQFSGSGRAHGLSKDMEAPILDFLARSEAT